MNESKDNIIERVTLSGGCHCGAVRFNAKCEINPELLDCNCSICSKTGFLHLIIPHKAFALETGKEKLTSYRFGSGQAVHMFCKCCGVKSFYQPRSHPDCWSINYRCLDDGDMLNPTVTSFDGQNWDQAQQSL